MAPACIPVTEGKKTAKTWKKSYGTPSCGLYFGSQFSLNTVAEMNINALEKTIIGIRNSSLKILD